MAEFIVPAVYRRLTGSLVVLFTASLAIAAQTERPNIVFILADDLGYADLGFHGSEIRTPHIDRLAAEGLELTRSYTQPQCTPTRVAFLTGCYPYRFGLHEHIIAPFSREGLPKDTPTIAERLRTLGYYTAAIGKWHVGEARKSYLPNQRGFDHFFGCNGGSISYWNYRSGDRYDLNRNGEKIYPASAQGDEASGNTYVTDLFADEAVNLISKHDQQRPLFLYLAITTPHSPWHAPEALQARYLDGKRATHRANYMAMVESMDLFVGRIMKALRAAGMYENTLVVFLSDNGGPEPALNTPFSGVKGTALEGGVRVPTVVHWPGVTKPNSKADDLVYIADWHATFLEIASGKKPEDKLDGVSLLPVLHGQSGQRQAVPIISYADHAYITPEWSLVAVDSDYNGLLESKMAGARLYHLGDDPAQQKDLSATRPDVFRELFEQFRPHLRGTHRGQFSWDMLVTRHFQPPASGDHQIDRVIDDIATPIKPANQMNLPSHDSFLVGKDKNQYRIGRIHDESDPVHGIDFGIKRAGFLPISDGVNARHIFVRDESLTHPYLPANGGLLSLETKPRTQLVSLTRYSSAVRARGTYYFSLLLQHDSSRQGDSASISFLRLVSQFSDVLNVRTAENDVECFTLKVESGGLSANQRELQHIAPYDNRAVHLVFKFELGATGQDILQVYVNPDPTSSEPKASTATFRGEFAFDRVRFELRSIYGHQTTLKIDDLRMGTTWNDLR
jgi:arylsulfatase A-like enzyme